MPNTNNLKLDLVMDNKPIEQLKTIKYLRLIIDEKLNWED